MTANIAIGIGCRRGIASAPVVALVRAAVAQARLSIADATLFTIDAKRDEAGLTEASRILGRPLVFLPRETLAQTNTPSQSEKSHVRFGVSSVAESAALAGIGGKAILAVPRLVQDGVTCAIARAAR